MFNTSEIKAWYPEILILHAKGINTCSLILVFVWYAMRSLLNKCFSVESSTWSRTGSGESASFNPIALLYVGQKMYRFRSITTQSAPAILHPHNWRLCSRMCRFEFVWSLLYCLCVIVFESVYSKPEELLILSASDHLDWTLPMIHSNIYYTSGSGSRFCCLS